MRMFEKEEKNNETFINLDFENTMFTNCIDNEEICKNKFSLRLDGLLQYRGCLLYTSPSPRDRTRSRMPSSA